MNIIIKNTNKYDLNFFNWLIEKIKSYLLMFDDFSRYKQIEEYINSNILRSKKYRYLSMHDIFFIAAASYECINYGSTAIIQINPQIKINIRTIYLHHANNLLAYSYQIVLFLPLRTLSYVAMYNLHFF